MTFRAIYKRLTRTKISSRESNTHLMIRLESYPSSSEDDEEVELLATNDSEEAGNVVKGEEENSLPASSSSKPGRSCSTKCLWCFLFVAVVFGVVYVLKKSLANNTERSGVSDVKNNNIDVELPPQKPSSGIINHDLKNIITNTKKKKTESCSDFDVELLWYKRLEKFQTESAIRMVDLNGDRVDDLVSGFVTTLLTDEESPDIKQSICERYNNGINPCQGGVFALDGVTGDQMWVHYTDNEAYSINCNADFNLDHVADCLIAGRNGLFQAINGKNGKPIWKYNGTVLSCPSRHT